MLYPSINVLRTKVDSKYTLVSMAAKRARDLIDGKPALVPIKIDKPVSIATEEIADDLITYTRDFSTEEEAKELEEEAAAEQERMLAAGYEAVAEHEAIASEETAAADEADLEGLESESESEEQ